MKMMNAIAAAGNILADMSINWQEEYINYEVSDDRSCKGQAC